MASLAAPPRRLDPLLAPDVQRLLLPLRPPAARLDRAAAPHLPARRAAAATGLLVARLRAGARLLAPVQFIPRQEAGGFLMLAGTLLWQSRGAIRRAFSSVRSSAEPSAPRWPLWGFLASNIGLALWAAAAGAQVWAFLLIMAVYYMMALVISRLVSAGGVMFVDTGFFPRGLLTGAFGAGGFTPV